MTPTRTLSWMKPRTDRHPLARRKLAPMVEMMEERKLMASGFLSGVVTLDGAGTPVAGATVQLFKPNSNTPVAKTTTDASGHYLLTGIAPGNYQLKEVPPSGYQAVNAFVNSQLNPASVAGSATINVTVVDPNAVYVNYGGLVPGSYEVVNDKVNGGAQVNSVGPFADTLGTTAGATNLNSGYQTFCVNDLQSLPFDGGVSYKAVPKPVTAITNGKSTISADHAGRVAYLFNHYGNDSLTNIEGAGLQLAIWELIYDSGNTPDFSSGSFQVTSPYAPTDAATLSKVIAQAKAYFNESAGHNEMAVFLDPTGVNPCGASFQGVLATGSYDFSVKKVDCHPSGGCGDQGKPSCDWDWNSCWSTCDDRDKSWCDKDYNNCWTTCGDQGKSSCDWDSNSWWSSCDKGGSKGDNGGSYGQCVQYTGCGGSTQGGWSSLIACGSWSKSWCWSN